MLWGFLGVAGFSLTLPATRAAVFGLDPLFVAFGRAALAAGLAGALLLGEPMDSDTAGFALGATMLVALSRRSAVRSPLLTDVAVTRTPEGERDDRSE